MKQDPTRPVQLKKRGQEEFLIAWEDGHESIYGFRYLRQNCGCAACRSEITGERLLNPESVPADLKGLKVELVGNYALHIRFSDDHNSGIYPYKILRQLCPCNSCKLS